MRDRQPERFGGLEINDKLERRRLLDRQIGRLGALEDLSGVTAEFAKGSSVAGPVCDQTAGNGKSRPE